MIHIYTCDKCAYCLANFILAYFPKLLCLYNTKILASRGISVLPNLSVTPVVISELYKNKQLYDYLIHPHTLEIIRHTWYCAGRNTAAVGKLQVMPNEKICLLPSKYAKQCKC